MSTNVNAKQCKDIHGQCKDIHGDNDGGGAFDGRRGSEGCGGAVVLEVFADDVLVVVLVVVEMAGPEIGGKM